MAQVLTYLRLHLLQQGTALLYGGTQPDVSRDLRRLLPLLEQLLPCPAVWEVKEESLPLTEAEVLTLTDLADQRALVDATEQVVYRSQDNEERKKYYWVGQLANPTLAGRESGGGRLRSHDE